MSQFGGASRHDDYGYFTAPARPTATTSPFGGAPTTGGGHFGGAPAAGTTPAGGRPPLPPGAHAHRSSRRILLPVVLVLVVLLAAVGVTWQFGLVPGLGAEPAPVSSAAASPYTVKPPKKLLGWTLSHGAQAKQIDAAFRSGGGFGADPLTTFLYTDTRHRATAYGAVVLAPLTAQDQRAFIAGATSSLSSDGEGVAVGTLKPVSPGKAGGTMRCTRLGTVPASTACVFATKSSAGVVVVLGHSGTVGVDKARAVRAAVVHRI